MLYSPSPQEVSKIRQVKVETSKSPFTNTSSEKVNKKKNVMEKIAVEAFFKMVVMAIFLLLFSMYERSSFVEICIAVTIKDGGFLFSTIYVAYLIIQ